MAERSKSLSRRDFNKLFTAGIVTAVSLPFIYDKLTETDASFLEGVRGVEALPAELYGVHFNAPYLWRRTEGQIDEFVNFTRETFLTDVSSGKKHIVRILPESPGFFVENKLGEINTSQLNNLKYFIDYLPSDFQVILPVIDGYWLFRSDVPNPMYPPSRINSPYIHDTSSQRSKLLSQESFFRNQNLKEAYKNRADAFIDWFGESDKVLLEMGNEVAMPGKIEYAYEKNSIWYAEMYSHIRRGYQKPLLTGVADPGSINYNFFNDTEGLVTTDHVYLPRLFPYTSDIPVIIEEIGVSREMYGFDFRDADIALKHLIIGGLKNGIQDGVARVGSVFVWHADHWHSDNLQFNEENYPEATKLITDLSLKLQNLQAI